ncbi:methylmalonyl-CoA epimerase [Singulisphaera sp. GP187]|uniref:VOC family protein n=1 Tax=Singulisphaera sp. GP187 TaxID=1882752 RepID=UPI000929D9E7|nr:VOC family protein [Singulisphaera sp. GP187]SIO61473.1 methylmalonyl-CoA epimerase [Singulisphaera sp. GP187]
MTKLNLHHIGILVKEIDVATEDYVHRFGCEIRSRIIHDPEQTAFVRFLSQPGDSVFLELVAPDGEASKLSNALNKGGGLNHLCYAVDDLEAACLEMRTRGMFPVQAPTFAVAFPGRRIAWMIGRDGIPIELVERGPHGEI